MTKPTRTTTTIYVRVPLDIDQKISEQCASQAITKKELICRALVDYVANKNLLIDEIRASEQRLKKFMLKSVQAVVETPEESPPELSEFDKATRRG